MTDERRMFVEALRDFAERECGSREQYDALTDGDEDMHNQGLYERLGGLGYLGVGLPEEAGGGGGTIVDSSLLMEELFYAKLPVFGITTALTAAGAIERHATGDLRNELLSAVCEGRVIALGFSEPEAGSDLAALRCKAVPADGGWIVNGQKTWTSTAHIADRILLMARTGKGPRKHDGISMLDVSTGLYGIEINLIPTLGGRETNDVFFADVFVSGDRLIGVEGEGWKQLMSGLNGERLLMAAMFLGQGRRALDDTLEYVRERKQFGQAIGTFQTLKHRIADLATELECCRLLVYDVARRVEADPDTVLAREASMTKLKVTETAKKVALEGMQMMGGYGYASEYGMVRHVRNALVATIYGGTSEIQREIIGSTYGL